MKIKLIILSITTLSISFGFGQVQQNSIPKKVGVPSTAISVLPNKGFSPQSAFLLMELDKLKNENKKIQKSDSLLINKYSLFFIGNEPFVNSFLILSDEFDKSELESKGGFINSTIKNIITASIPVNKLNEVIELNGIIYVQISEKGGLSMDNARASTRVDWVHQGNELPQAYFGTGVVVGIIDGGFDYTHPNFYDETGSNNYRVKRVWDQNATSGTPPSGFSYGKELKTQTEILNAIADTANLSHGTHVAGIAAGAGGGENTTLMGVAPQSELVFVSTTATDTTIIDGINYIFSYATSMNKPCVINLSLGKHIGPHDGMSVLDQYYDLLVGPGKLLVGAAGNEGNDPLHISKTYTSLDNTLYSFVNFKDSSNPTNGQTTIDIWGDPNQNYEVAVNIYNTNTNSFEDWTPYVQANSNNTYSYILDDDDILVPDSCNVVIGANQYPLNNKHNVQVIIDNSAQDDDYKWAMIEIRATNGQTKMWACDIHTNPGKVWFTNEGKGFPWVSGLTSSTVGEIGGTGNSIISVGSYTSKNSWTGLNNVTYYDTSTQIGEIALSSSVGPTADNRTKPDITAPGNHIASSVNRYDINYTSTSPETVSEVINGTNTYYFGLKSGTSMASPMVTGILALWLEAYPNLTHTQALQLLKVSAETDSFTGTIPSTGNNTWGWGKVDAHGGLLELINTLNVDEIDKVEIVRIYPNPTNSIINIDSKIRFDQAQIYSVLGQKIFSKKLDLNQIIDLSELSAGFYNLILKNSDQIQSVKILKE